ncbi:MAG: ParB/RepB/Spo0J family partition protein [Ruminococcus flavefaciens]|nr:ParB/RepB/Spo0J family partition protein [Ruminococcus flavefaciens]
MAKDFTKNMNFKSFDDIFGNNDGSEDSVVKIKLDELHAFKDHPFRVIEDEDMEDLIESIRQIGVATPIEVRTSKEEPGYEIISGHRRTFASRKAGLTEIPAIIKELTDYDAVLRMTAANKYRSKIFPSEKARAYKMQYEALKEKARLERKDGEKQEKRTDVLLAESTGESRASVQRYLKLNNLCEELLALVDQEVIGLTAAQPLANIDTETQLLIYRVWDEHNHPKLTKEVTESLYENYSHLQNNQRFMGLSREDILWCFGFLNTETKKPVKVTLNEKRLSQYFPATYSQEEIENVIESLLMEWAEKNGMEQHKAASIQNEALKGQYKVSDINMSMTEEE